MKGTSKEKTPSNLKSDKVETTSSTTSAPCTVCGRRYHLAQICRLKNHKYANLDRCNYVGSDAHKRLVAECGEANRIPDDRKRSDKGMNKYTPHSSTERNTERKFSKNSGKD